MVAPTIISTEQPYPASRMILSTLAISVADGQFMSAIVISPQFAKAEDPKTVMTDAIEIPVKFLIFIVAPYIKRIALVRTLNYNKLFSSKIQILSVGCTTLLPRYQLAEALSSVG